MTGSCLRGFFVVIVALAISSPVTVAYAMYANADQRSKSRLTIPHKSAQPLSSRIPVRGAVDSGLQKIAVAGAGARMPDSGEPRKNHARSREMNKEGAPASSDVNAIALVGLCIAVMSMVRRVRRL